MSPRIETPAGPRRYAARKLRRYCWAVVDARTSIAMHTYTGRDAGSTARAVARELDRRTK